MKYKELAERIINLKKVDLAYRNKLIQAGQLGDGYDEGMADLHNKNARILEEIIDEIGFPTSDKVGEAGSEAAWLVIQHAIGQPDFMRKCEKLLAEVANENKAYQVYLAYLSDRIAVFEGRPQLYGTQFDWDEFGKLSPQAFADEARVNERRQTIGLNTLAEQTQLMRERVEAENEVPPLDYDKRKAELMAWKRKVGWID